MRFGSRRIVYGAVGTAAAWLLSVAYVGGQAPQTGAPTAAQSQMAAEQVFKNVTVLNGIPVDEFMGTMGVFSAALGFSCEDCHTASSNDWANYAKDVSPRKTMARQMVTMMQGINKQYFGGRQVVTCFSCHRGSNRPKVTASLDILYGTPPPDELDVLVLPGAAGRADRGADPGQVSGGRRRRAARGGSDQLRRQGDVFRLRSGRRAAAARDLRQGAEPEDRARRAIRTSGDNITTFNGTAGWVSAPFKPIDVLELHGAELDSARADAELLFPGQHQDDAHRHADEQRLHRRPHGPRRPGPERHGDRHAVFRRGNGLLTRSVRSTPSPVGRLPVRIDYSDYRDVNGLKMPFKWQMKWLDGRSNFEIDELSDQRGDRRRAVQQARAAEALLGR